MYLSVITNLFKLRQIVLLVLLSSCILIVFVLLPRDNSLTKHQQADVIRIGYAIEAPYAYIDANGTVTGESPEIARVIVRSLGITRIEWIQTDFDLLIPELLDERFDVIAAGMFITPARAQSVRFSNPTFHVQPGLLVRLGNPHQLYAYQDIVDNQDIRVAAISGSVEIKLLQELGILDRQLIVVPDALTGKVAVTSGVADALALSSATVRWMAANDETNSTEAAEITNTDNLQAVDNWGYGGFVFRPQDNQLAEAWNTSLASFIGSAEHLNMIIQFGFTSQELPNLATTTEILQNEY